MKKETIENGLVLVPRDVWNNHITRDEFDFEDHSNIFDQTLKMNDGPLGIEWLIEYQNKYTPILKVQNGIVKCVHLVMFKESPLDDDCRSVITLVTHEYTEMGKSMRLTLPDYLIYAGAIGTTKNMMTISRNEYFEMDSYEEQLNHTIEWAIECKRILRLQEIDLLEDVNKLVVTDLDGVPVKEYNSPVLINNFKSFLLTDASFPTMLTDRTRNIFLIKKLYQSGGIKIEDGVMYYSTVQTDQSAVDYVENNIIIKFNRGVNND